MVRDIKATVRSDPRLLQAVRGLVRGYLENLGYSDARIAEVVLAVDEACANAMRHSYQGATDGELTLALNAGPGGVTITLRDKGTPIAAERLRRHAERNAAPPSPRELRPGGLGVRIMHRSFDEVAFRPGKVRGNCITMRLKPPREE